MNPKRLLINLTGFLEGETMKFVSELWNLLLTAQSSVGGIPPKFIEAKKLELAQQKVVVTTCPILILRLNKTELRKI